MRVTVGSREFASKTGLKDHIRSIVSRYAVGARLNGDDDTFVRALFERHPDAENKIGAGISHVTITRDQWGNKSFWIFRRDGSDTDISWVACVDQKRERRIAVLGTLRWEIQEQIAEFKKAAFRERDIIICAVTQSQVRWSDAHVDHAPPEKFLALAQRWLFENELNWDTVAIGGYADGEQHKYLADRTLADNWRDFHRKNAVLRIVMRQANLSQDW